MNKPDGDSLTPTTKIRQARTLKLSTAVAIGSCVTVGLGIYFLIGPVNTVIGDQISGAYFLTILFFLPIALALAERSAVTPGAGSLFNLTRTSGSVLLSYLSGWFLLGGIILLSALFSRFGGETLSEFFAAFFEFTVPPEILTPIFPILIFFAMLFKNRGGWSVRSLIIYGSIILLIVILIYTRRTELESSYIWIYYPDTNILTAIPFFTLNLWGMHFILNRHETLVRPSRTTFPALYLPILIGGVVGGIAASLLVHYPAITINQALPIVSLATKIGPLLGILVMLTMVIIALIGLNESIGSGLQLTAAMAEDGFLPNSGKGFFSNIVLLRLLAITALTITITVFIDIKILVGLTSFSFIVLTVLVLGQDLFRPKPHLPPERRFKLPFHPLFPGLAIALSITAGFLIPWEDTIMMIPWFLLGLIVYVIYSRHGAVKVRWQEVVFSTTVAPDKKSGYRLLVAMSDPEKGRDYLQLGARIAANNGGELLVLHVLKFDEIKDSDRSEQEKLAWQKINEIVNSIEGSNTHIIPIVRLAQTRIEGILATAWEEQVDSILLGWPGSGQNETGVHEEGITEIVGKAQSEVLIFHGPLPEKIERLLVPTMSAGHTLASIDLGQTIIKDGDGEIVAIDVLAGEPNEESVQIANQEIQKKILKVEDASSITAKVIVADSIRKGVFQEAEDFDLVLLGLSGEGFLARTGFYGLPVELASYIKKPVILVKSKENTLNHYIRRVWEQLSDAIPNLTIKRQLVVNTDMKTNSRANIDFYTLIVLATAIAFLGLVQNSAAVIIGAMLVAPLMSPILAMSHSIVRGNINNLRISANSTLNGVVLAITIGALLTLFLISFGFPISPTNEILARTQPNMLDLLVALASGAAAAYAVSRSEVAAALPGVAIAAALVPPLAVVGYGLGTAQFNFASGALLLFLTNLAAIVFAAAITFLLLGFRPPSRIERGQQARFGFRIAVIGLVLISIPLVVTTFLSNNQANQVTAITEILEARWPPYYAEVEDIVINQERFGEVHVDCTYFDYEGVVTQQSLARLQVSISEEIDKEVVLTARVIYSEINELDEQNSAILLTATPTPNPTQSAGETMTPAATRQP